MDDGLQLNLSFAGEDFKHKKQLDWRSRKRQAHNKQRDRKQQQRAGPAGPSVSAPTAGRTAPASAAAAAATVAGPRHTVTGPGAAAASHTSLSHRAANGVQLQQHAKQQSKKQQSEKQQSAGQQRPSARDSLYGYNDVLHKEQPEFDGSTTAKTSRGAVSNKAAQRQAKPSNVAAAVAADASAAADSSTAADEGDIMALVALNMDIEHQLQQEAAAAAKVGGSSSSKKRTRQQDQASPGVVEFGDAPDEPDLDTLAQQAANKAKQQQQPRNKRHKPNTSSSAPSSAKQQQQQLVQHKVGEMAHAEPNVPADQRQQLFGHNSNADAAGGSTGAVATNSHSWQGLGLSEQLSAHLIALNFQEPTSVQQQSVPVLLAGRDVLVRSPTGSGKTLSYLAPVVHSLQCHAPRIVRSDGTYALVLVPTRELAVQVSDVLTAVVRRFCWLVPGMLIGGEHRGHEKARLRKGITVLVATPGRLLDHLQNTSSFRTDKLKWLILDEADRLLDLGFEQKLKQIVESLDARVAAAADNSYSAEAQSQRQTVLLSATLHPGLSSLAGLSMKDPVGVGFKTAVVDGKLEVVNADKSQGDGSDTQQQQLGNQAGDGRFEMPQQLQQKYVQVPAKMRLVLLIGVLRSRLRRSKCAKLVVFFSNCDSVDFHHQLLQQQQQSWVGDADAAAVAEALLGSTPVLKLHGDMKQPERTSSLVTFAKASSCVLLCTDVAARGLDFPAVSTIIQYDPAGDPAEYVHRVGRTARMGQQGEALLFLLPSEIPYVQLLQQSGVQLSQQIAGDLLQCLPGLVGSDGLSVSVMQLAHKLRRGSTTRITEQHKGDKAEAGKQAAIAADGKGTQRGYDDEGLQGAKPEQVAAAVLLQRQLIQRVSGDVELSKLALNAFRSSVRAYTTHPSSLKHVFHIKSLHLGHLAASFGLKEAPKKIGAGGSVAERKKRKMEGQKAVIKKQKQAWHRTAKAAAAMGS